MKIQEIGYTEKSIEDLYIIKYLKFKLIEITEKRV